MDDEEAFGYFDGDDFEFALSVVDSDVEPSRVTAFGGGRCGLGCGHDVADVGFTDAVFASRLREPQLHTPIVPHTIKLRQDIALGSSPGGFLYVHDNLDRVVRDKAFCSGLRSQFSPPLQSPLLMVRRAEPSKPGFDTRATPATQPPRLGIRS